MKLTESIHTFLHIILIIWITNSCVVKKFCDLITIFRINIFNVITEMLILDNMINLCFFTSVNQLIGSFTGNTHNVFKTSTFKQERTICHAFFQDGNVCNLFRLCMERISSNLQNIRLQVIRIRSLPKNFHHSENLYLILVVVSVQLKLHL